MRTESDIDRFCKEHGVIISAISARSERPEKGRDSDWDRKASHFHVTLSRGDREIWTGFYSVGSAWPEVWAQNGCRVPDHVKRGRQPHQSALIYDNQARTAYRNLTKTRAPGGGVTLHDEKLWQTIRARFEALGCISPGDVLGSLVLDASGADQPFADWASDLGYSDDSISAKETWEACNDIRRALQSAFPTDQLETLYELEI